MNMKSESPNAQLYRLVRRPVTADAAPEVSLTTLAEVQQEMSRVYADIRANKIDSGSGKVMIGALEQVARLIEPVEISKRIAALERGTAPRTRSRKTLAGVHHTLAVMERVRARIEALARLDIEEVERLDATCPPAEWNLFVHAQTKAIVRTYNIQLEAAWYGQQACLFMFALGIQETCQGEKITAGFIANIRQYQVLAEAFDRFSRAIGIAPETLRRSINCKPLLMIDSALEIALCFEGTAPPEDLIVTYFETMTKELRSLGLL